MLCTNLQCNIWLQCTNFKDVMLLVSSALISLMFVTPCVTLCSVCFLGKHSFFPLHTQGSPFDDGDMHRPCLEGQQRNDPHATPQDKDPAIMGHLCDVIHTLCMQLEEKGRGVRAHPCWSSLAILVNKAQRTQARPVVIHCAESLSLQKHVLSHQRGR